MPTKSNNISETLNALLADSPTRLVRSRFSTPVRNGMKTWDPSATVPDFADECDINNVILRFAGTGELPPRQNARVAEFLDVSDVGDLHESLLKARQGRDFFDALPEEVRAAVGHNPERLLDAIEEHAKIRASTLPDVSKPAESAAAASTPPAP